MTDHAPRAAASPPPRRPRNYLATGERRRLVWSLFPVAAAVLLGLSWLERSWFPRPDGGAPAIDTRLESVVGRPPGADEVVIERDSEPLDDAPAAGLSASKEALARVRDATFFRQADEDAWFQTWNTLRDQGMEPLRHAAVRPVGFRELFGQPRSFRGRLVSMRGTLHRLEEVTAPGNDYGIDRYWQGWLEPEGGPSSPVVVQSLAVPAGIATGLSIDEPVQVIGYFFKNYAYAAADTVRVAPVIMTLEPVRRPRAAPVSGAGSTLVVATMVATMAGLVAATWLGARAARRPAAAPATVEDLDAVLADFRTGAESESTNRPGA